MKRIRTRRSQAGQTVLIFAFVSVFLFVAVGLSIDAGLAYLQSDRAERAAAAGALAGVTYLPEPSPPLTASTLAAKTETARNGFRDNPPSVKVTVTAPTTNRLKVSIQTDTTPTFLRLLGFTKTTITRDATAEYLRPISLGQPGAQQGSDLTALGGSGNNYYFMRTEGWGNPRSEGDAYTPNPNQSGNAAVPPDIHQLSSDQTTETADAAVPPATSDLGGYNYLVFVPPGLTADVQVFNAGFAPDNSGILNANNVNYHEYDGSWAGNCTDYGGMEYSVYGVNNLFDHRNETLLSQVSVMPIDAAGEASTNPPQTISMPGGVCTKTNMTGWPGTAAAWGTLKFYHQWASVVNPPSAFTISGEGALYHTPSNTLLRRPAYLSGGAVGGKGAYYRLKVDTEQWDGSIPDHSQNNGSKAHKGYAVRVTTGGTNTVCATCTVSALDDMCFYTPIPGASASAFDIPLFGIGAEYAGKSVVVNIYDPGDISGGNAYLKIIQPAYPASPTAKTAQVSTPVVNLGNQLNGAGAGSNVASAGGVNDAYVQTASGGSLFNGKWLQFFISIPADYNPAAITYWNLEYSISSGGTASDTLTVEAGYNGAPVHLLP